MTKRSGLSKSRITAFEQCHRRLWLQVHRPEAAAQHASQRQRLATGHAVGEMACMLHPDGVMVEAEPDLAAAVATTQRLIAGNHPGPIFEATFAHEGVLVRADILLREGDSGWRMIEVKSSTGVKDYHLGDLATQVWVAGQCGIPLAGAAIRHIDNRFVLTREGDYDGLFADADLLDVVAPVAAGRGAVVEAARNVLAGDEPACDMGDHCAEPVACEFSTWCSRGKAQGPQWPVTDLPRKAGRKWQAQGITDLLDLDERAIAPLEARIVGATRSGVPYHDAAGAARAMAAWRYPRAWLDFETIAFAIPRWLGTRPYQAVPFQFSLHLEQADGTIAHHEFLDLTGEDPRQACAEALVALIPPGATIIAYNAGFERMVLRSLALACPRHAQTLLGMAEAAADLLPVTRQHWYHRDQRGDWSIKAVLPTIGEAGYGDLDVKDGGNAQAAYLEAIDPQTDAGRKAFLAQGLRIYCQQDTSAMIALAHHLTGAAPG